MADMLVFAMLMAVAFSVAVVALVEEEGEHTQETELGVHVDSHCPLTSGPQNTSPPAWLSRTAATVFPTHRGHALENISPVFSHDDDDRNLVISQRGKKCL